MYIQPMGTWLARLRNRSLTVRATLLLAVVVMVWLAVLPFAFVWGAPSGLWASGLAALACLIGAELALVTSHLLRAPERVLWGVLLGMGMRMGVPLIFGLVVQVGDGPLAKAGLLLYLLVFFPVTLAVETALSLPQTQPPGRATPCTKAS